MPVDGCLHSSQLPPFALGARLSRCKGLSRPFGLGQQRRARNHRAWLVGHALAALARPGEYSTRGVKDMYSGSAVFTVLKLSMLCMADDAI